MDRKARRWSKTPIRPNRKKLGLGLVALPSGSPVCPGGRDCLGMMPFAFAPTLEEIEDGFEDLNDCIGLGKLPEGIARLQDPDRVALKASSAILVIDYPIENPVQCRLKPNRLRGFTTREVITAIADAYAEIYAGLESSSAKIPDVGSVWHSRSDLYIEGVHIYRADGETWIAPHMGS